MFTSSITPSSERINNRRFKDLLTICENIRDEYDMFCGCDNCDELRTLVNSGCSFTAYHGFEPSGQIDLQIVITILNIKTIIRNNGKVIIYIADYFAKLNKKLNGDLSLIKKIGQQYIDYLKHVFDITNDTNEAISFKWAYELINQENSNYWQRVVDISEKFTIQQIKQCSIIMGHSETEFLNLNASQFLYPLIQCADMFELNAHNGGIQICQLGIDQRNINLLARKYAKMACLVPPIILSNTVLPKHKHTIYITDSDNDIIDKVMHTDNLYIYQYITAIQFRWFNKVELKMTILTPFYVGDSI